MGHKPNEFQIDYAQRSTYFHIFEILTTLFVLNVGTVVNTTLELIRAIHDHLALCQETLGKTEALIEQARIENAPPEKIKGLASLCRSMQEMQMTLVDNVVNSMNNVIENILPR